MPKRVIDKSLSFLPNLLKFNVKISRDSFKGFVIAAFYQVTFCISDIISIIALIKVIKEDSVPNYLASIEGREFIFCSPNNVLRQKTVFLSL